MCVAWCDARAAVAAVVIGLGSKVNHGVALIEISIEISEVISRAESGMSLSRTRTFVARPAAQTFSTIRVRGFTYTCREHLIVVNNKTEMAQPQALRTRVNPIET